jgi:hypothetical protein
MSALPLPTFLIIGAQKSATRWLRLNLGLHPDVFVSRTEIEFFNNAQRFDELGEEWYRTQFAGWEGEPFVGEATPGYMFLRDDPSMVSQRIGRMVPAARLLAILRNPIDRAQSALAHHISFGALPPETDLLDYVRGVPPERDHLGIISGGWYAASLEPFANRFGDQLLVLLHDDVDDDPRAVYNRALCHVGVAPDFAPMELERVRFSTQSGMVRHPAEHRLELEARRELYEFFASDVEKLSAMLDRDLSIWAPGAPVL